MSAVVALLLAGCSSGSADRPAVAADLVREAQQSLRTAGSGHVTVRRASQTNAGKVVETWDGDYDLGRHLWNAQVVTGVGDRVSHYLVMGTEEHIYLTGLARRGYATGKWQESQAVAAPGIHPYVFAVLEFEMAPGATANHEGDGWSIAGTLPIDVAVRAAAVIGPTAAEQDTIAGLTGRAPVTLALGPDGAPRGLRMAGADVEVPPSLPDTTRQSLATATLEVDISDLGYRVEIAEPQPDRITRT